MCVSDLVPGKLEEADPRGGPWASGSCWKVPLGIAERGKAEGGTETRLGALEWAGPLK